MRLISIYPREAGMYRHIMRIVCAFALSILSISGVAQAVSLGKIDVASHLGEPFYAEVPLGLEDGESIANVFVSLATDSDYRLLEVFHDAAVDAIKVNIKRDKRGNRMELSSPQPLKLPFFNVILKVKQGRATHFKKFSVFLDLPKLANQLPQKHAVKPIVQKPMMVNPLPSDATSVATVQDHASKKANFWARTQRYGPMVFGDTITTVAQRLRVDQRFSTKQVMLALFEKNQQKFTQKNINLIKAGTYLDVPTADEVMRHNDVEARQILRQHSVDWKKLTEQKRYAKVKEAQKNRYAKHVVMGEKAMGVAKHPEAIKNAPNHKLKDTHDSLSKGAHGNVIENATRSLLKQENNDLKKRLKNLEGTLSKISSQPTNEEALAALTAQEKRLEIKLARQNGALQKAQQELLAQQANESGIGLLTWILIAVVTLLSMLIGYLVYMLKGNRQHPVKQEPKAKAAQASELDDLSTHNGFDEPSMDEPNTDLRDVVEAADAFEDIPDLTNEDTSEMEAFQDLEEEPDPNVDYLSEADVYMRYGMDDEAEKQINMALRLREDNKDGHIKRVKIRHARGDEAGVKEALKTAKVALVGSSLATFMTFYEGLVSGVESGSDVAVPEDATSNVGEFDLPDLSNDEKVDLDSDDLDLSAMNWSVDDLDFKGSESSGLDLLNKDTGSSDDIATMDVSDELNLDDISLSDFDSDSSDLLSDADDSSNLISDHESMTTIDDVSDELNLDDLDLNDMKSLDLNAVNHDANLEEFTSTIQAPLKELGVDNNDLDESSEHLEDVDANDLDFGELNLDDFEENNSNTKDDFDASLELDSLLSELDNFSTK
ncbi:MAG: FimV/HubP family polar landmark protein [Mariprofundaceae bacterium]|nr:FimV/HubP family polar landmark protein [Mariprofundaceae bacterium]